MGYYEEKDQENKEYMKKWRQKNKEKIKKLRHRNKEQIKKYNKEYRLKNKEHSLAYQKEYYKKNKKQIDETNKEYYEKNKGKTIEYQRKLALKTRYNLTLEKLDEMLIGQNHKCLICDKSLMETRRCVDHNHKTGKIRGILCIECNSVLGMSHDNVDILKKAIDYLKR